MKKNNNMTMNVDKSDTHWMIKFADSKEKNKTTDKLTSSASKTKNVWLTDIFHCAVEKNSIQIIQKMLCIIVSDIIIEDILMSESIIHKLMFKFNKSDIITKISDIEKINVNSIQLCQLKNVLYLLVSLRAAMNIDEKQISALLDLKMKVNLVEKKILKRLSIFYSIDCWLKLVNINDEKTILCSIIKNVSVWINLICVIQSLLIVKKASQSMILNMSYVSATFMIIRTYSNDEINVEITSSQSDRW